MSTKQWFQVEVGNEIVMYLLLSFISNLDFKSLFVPIEANLGRIYYKGELKPENQVWVIWKNTKAWFTRVKQAQHPRFTRVKQAQEQ